MINNCRILLIPFHILSCLNLSHAFSQDDLARTSIADFTLEANVWTLSSAVCPSCSKLYTIPANTCGVPQETIFGGPNIIGPQGSSAVDQYFERQYSGATVNGYRKGVQFDIWIFSKEILANPATSVTNWFTITINSEGAYYPSYELLESCQIDYTDSNGIVIKAFYKFRYQAWATLTTSTAVLRIIQTVSSPTTLNSFGFKNIKVYMLASSSYYPIRSANFPCFPPKYWDGSSTTCSDCYSGCWACTGPLVGDCFACDSLWYENNNTCLTKSCSGPFIQVISGGYRYCKKRCPTGYYWGYDSGSCRDNCSSPLQPSIDQNGFDVCVNPCYKQGFLYPDGSCSSSCSSPQFKIQDSFFCVSSCENTTKLSFLNGTCTSTCESPLFKSVGRGIFTCQSPCANKYIYANTSCSSDCKPPLVKRDESDIKFCVNPCTDPVNEYLYLDGACKLECPSPLLSRSEPEAKYCWNPCTSPFSPYLYPNSTCKSDCKSPLKTRTQSEIKYCENPCPDPVNEFLYLDGTCKLECPSPLLSRSEPGAKYCWNPCTSSWASYLYPNSTCKSGCNAPLISRTESEIKYCENPCSDPVKEFLYLDGTCKLECPSPFLSRSEPGAKYCWNPCTSASAPFLYPNLTCKATCNSPLKSRTESGILYCYNPCPDPVNQYLYTLGDCKSECLLPLRSRSESGVNYCWSPCDFNTEYLFDNGDCSGHCIPPLGVKIDPDFVRYCQNPCYVNSTFFYSNGSCLSNCVEPLVQKIENGVKYCLNPCSNSNDYLYLDKTCSAKCPSPLLSKIELVAKYCFSPCENPQHEYFNEADKTCISACLSPYISKTVHGVKVCVFTDQVDPEEAEKTKSTVSMIVSQGQATQAGLKAISWLNSANPTLALLAAHASMLFYIQFLDLNYTAKLKLFFLLQDASPFSFTLTIDVPEALEEKLRDRELPKVFEEYHLHSNFLYNSWDMLSSLLLALVLILFVTVLKVFSGRWRRIDKLVGGVLGILKWNIPLTIVCGGFGDIYLYASFQLQAASFDSISDVLCLILSIVMMFAGVAILFITVKIVKDLLKKSQEEKEGKWKNFQLLYENYERGSFFSFGYMALFLVRAIIFNLIIANLYSYPLVQSILINLLTILMFGYLVIKRPLKDMLELVQLFLNEIFLIIVNICVLIIAIMDHAGIEGQKLRDGVCETVIKIIIIIFSMSALAFVALQILISLYFFYKLLKRLKSEGKLSLSGILNAWLNGEEKVQEIKKLENLEEKKNIEAVPTINLGRRRYKKVNRNLSQLSLFDFQTQEKTVSNVTIQPLEIKKETMDQSHSDILDNSLISEVPMLNAIPRTRPGSGKYLKDHTLFEISQLIMESNNGNNSRVITIDPLDFAGNRKKNTSLAYAVEKEQERRNYLRRFGIQNFREKFWNNQEK